MPSISVHDLGTYLREQRESARLSVRQLSELAGVSNPYLSQIERGLKKPSAEILGQLAKGLRISAESLYVRAGILEQREDQMPVETAVLADPGLSERQRRVLLDIYETFRAENDRTATPSSAGASTETADPRTPSRGGRGSGEHPSAAVRAHQKAATKATNRAQPTDRSTTRATKRAAKTTQKKTAAAAKSAVRTSTPKEK